MAQLVDPFIPAKHPAHHTPTPPMLQGNKEVPEHQKMIPASRSRPTIGNEFVTSMPSKPMPPKKPALDHLRPQYMPPKPKPIAPPPANEKPPATAAVTEAPQTRPAPQVHRLDFTPPAKHQRRGLGLIKIVLAILGGLAFGLAIQSQTLGEILIGAYAAVAIIWKIESRLTFALALAALVAIMGMSLLKPGQSLANNFAVYAFLLLAVGTVSLALETRRGY
jgi:hypothetical protein